MNEAQAGPVVPVVNDGDHKVNIFYIFTFLIPFTFLSSKGANEQLLFRLVHVS